MLGRIGFKSSIRVVVAASLALVLPTVQSLRAQEVQLEETALAIAPQDAAFFATSLNLRQAWDEFMSGNLVTRLRAVPFIQEVEAEFNEQWADPDGQLGQARAMMNNPNIKNLISLALDMGSHEVFIYGGNDWCDALEGLIAFQSEMQTAISENPEQFEQFWAELTREDVAALRVPTTVIGFRLSDDKNARIQLDALEGILRLGASQAAELQPILEKLKRADLQDGQTLTLTLDTSLIPVDSLQGDSRQAAEKVIELLEGRSLSLGIGVKNNILLIAFGEDPRVVQSVGDTSDSLLGHEVFSVLKEAELSRLRGVSFASKQFRESQWEANFNSYFQRMTAQFTAAVRQEEGQSPEIEQWRNELAKDAAWMDERISDMAPTFGPTLAWSRATDSGVEGWSYDWSENVAFANASPLSILEHAGRGALLVVGWKQREMPGLEALLERMIERAPGHLRQFIALAEEDQQERQQALNVLEKVWPLVDEAYQVLTDEILPSMDRHETVVALAARWSTPTLGEDLPPPNQPLPLPELGVACVLTDRQQFIEGCSHLYDIFDKAVEVVRELDPDAVPPGYRVPRPTETAVEGATRYSYEEFAHVLPVEGFNPQLLVADDLLLVGFSQRQLEDMLSSQPLQARPAWLEEGDPVAMVSYVDVAGMVNAVRPWVAYGISLNVASLDEPLWDEAGPVPTGNDILQIWDCLTSIGKSAGTLTVSEEGPTVGRWVWVNQ